MTLLLGIATPALALYALNDHATHENGRRIARLKVAAHVEHELKLVLLAPLDKFGLEVDLHASHILDVDELAQHTMAKEMHHSVVATVEVYSPDESLKGIATKIAVVVTGSIARTDKAVQANFLGKAVERSALHNLTASVGEEALTGFAKVTIDDVADGGIQDSITEEFQPLVVVALAAARRIERLVAKRLLVETDVVGIEPEDAI